MNDPIQTMKDSVAAYEKKMDRLVRSQERIETQKAEIDRKLRAFRTVLSELLGNESVDTSHSDSSRKLPSKTSDLKNQTDLVREAVRVCALSVFTPDHIADLIHNLYPDEYGDLEVRPIRKVLARLARTEDELQIVQKGTGKTTTQYRKSQTGPNAEFTKDQGGSSNDPDGSIAHVETTRHY